MPRFNRVPTESFETLDDPTSDTLSSYHDGRALADEGRRSTLADHRFWQMIQERRSISVTEHESFSNFRSKYWVALCFGQCIAILAASTNAASFSLSSRYGVNTQFFQMFLMYILLSFHLMWKRPHEASPMMNDQEDMNAMDETDHKLPFTNIRLRVPWWIYLIMSFLDVFPNYLALFSYHYTSLTSTTLLGSLATPATMLFSKYILARVYRGHHFFGVGMCLLGGSITIWSDFDGATSKAHSYIGDVLAVVAAMMYGFGDTAAEFFVKHVDRFEYVGMLGLFGTIFTGLSFPFFEVSELVRISEMGGSDKLKVCSVMVWYVLSVLSYYITEAKFLQTSDATLLNLSLQAMNIWAVLFAVVVDHDFPSVPFYMALMLVVGGVFLYELGGLLRRDCSLCSEKEVVTQIHDDSMDRIEGSRSNNLD